MMNVAETQLTDLYEEEPNMETREENAKGKPMVLLIFLVFLLLYCEDSKYLYFGFRWPEMPEPYMQLLKYRSHILQTLLLLHPDKYLAGQ